MLLVALKLSVRRVLIPVISFVCVCPHRGGGPAPQADQHTGPRQPLAAHHLGRGGGEPPAALGAVRAVGRPGGGWGSGSGCMCAAYVAPGCWRGDVAPGGWMCRHVAGTWRLSVHASFAPDHGRPTRIPAPRPQPPPPHTHTRTHTRPPPGAGRVLPAQLRHGVLPLRAAAHHPAQGEPQAVCGAAARALRVRGEQEAGGGGSPIPVQTKPNQANQARLASTGGGREGCQGRSESPRSRGLKACAPAWAHGLYTGGPWVCVFGARQVPGWSVCIFNLLGARPGRMTLHRHPSTHPPTHPWPRLRPPLALSPPNLSASTFLARPWLAPPHTHTHNPPGAQEHAAGGGAAV